jgi:MGT family glycosyltransferase
MSTVIFFSVDLHGHVNPTLGLIRTLIERGEEVIYYSGEKFRERIEETGAVFKSYRDDIGFGTYDGGGIETFLVTADFILSRSRTVIDNVWEEVQHANPAYIIHDTFCYWGREMARMLGIPGISLFANFAFIDEMADIDPAFFMENVLRAGNDPLYKKHKGEVDVYRKIAHKLSKMLALKYGLKTVNVINDIFCSKEKLNLLFTSKPFQIYAEAFDDSYLFAGYPIYARKETVHFPYEALDGRPLIYIAFGTIFNNAAAFYEKCLQAFGGTEFQIVMSIGSTVAVETLGNLPDNFIVSQYVPQLEMLKRADAFVTHGGANSIHESLCFEVPTVVLPQSFDQFMGAIAVEKAGTGIFMREPDIGADELAEAVRSVLQDPKYRDNCREINRSLKEAGGLDRAVDVVFAFVAEQKKVVHR